MPQNENIIELVDAIVPKYIKGEWTLEHIRKLMNIQHVDEDTGRPVLVNKVYANYDTLSAVLFSLIGSPAKGYALYNVYNGHMVFMNSRLQPIAHYENVTISGLKDIPDEVQILEGGTLNFLPKHYGAFDRSNCYVSIFNDSENSCYITDDYNCSKDRYLCKNNFEKIILFEDNESGFTNAISCNEYIGDEYAWSHFSLGEYKLKQEIFQDIIIPILQKYLKKARQDAAFDGSVWGFTTPAVTVKEYYKMKQELLDVLIDMDNYIHDLEDGKG